MQGRFEPSQLVRSALDLFNRFNFKACFLVSPDFQISMGIMLHASSPGFLTHDFAVSEIQGNTRTMWVVLVRTAFFIVLIIFDAVIYLIIILFAVRGLIWLRGGEVSHG